MLKSLFRHQRENASIEEKEMKNGLIAWIEIPVNDLSRAVRFYENVFATKLTRQLVEDKSIAVFSEKELGIKGCLIQSHGLRASIGIKPVFIVQVMFEAIEKVKAFGGSIIKQPSLLKQVNGSGETVIGENLIDKQIGYICEITDSEGNGLFLYSHS